MAEAHMTGEQLDQAADRVVRMAAALREHLAAGRLLDAWAAADWLADEALVIKAELGTTQPVRTWRKDTLP